MKSCPLCGGPAPDRPGFPGALPCDRCAGAIDVSRALESVGPAPRPRRRVPWPWIAGGAGVLVAGILVGLFLPSSSDPGTREDGAARAEPFLAEARRRMQTPLPSSFREAMLESSRIEGILRDAEVADPWRAETPLLLGNLLLARGDGARSQASFDRALGIEPANPEALIGKGQGVVTAQLLLHLDRLRWPELTKALGARLAEGPGRSFDPLARRPAPESVDAAFARAYAAVARADWAGAKRALDPVSRSSLSPRMKDELGYTMFAVDYLADPKVPQPGSWAGLIRGEEGTAFEFGERGVWLLLVKHIERKAMLARLPVTRSPRHPVHAGLLRAEAALFEARGDARKAAEVLAEALAAAPDYLQARLARAAALSKLGEKAESAREIEAAVAIATRLGLPGAVLQEIRE